MAKDFCFSFFVCFLIDFLIVRPLFLYFGLVRSCCVESQNILQHSCTAVLEQWHGPSASPASSWRSVGGVKPLLPCLLQHLLEGPRHCGQSLYLLLKAQDVVFPSDELLDKLLEQRLHLGMGDLHLLLLLASQGSPHISPTPSEFQGDPPHHLLSPLHVIESEE